MSVHGQDGPHSAWRVAARYGDAEVEEGGGLFEAIARQGINTEEFQHIADQRALRVVLQQRGMTPGQLSTTRPEMVALDPLEKAAHILFTAAYFDGLYIGWRARGLAERTLNPADAAFVAEALQSLAEIDEGEYTDRDRLLEVAARLRGESDAEEG